ncbi:Crp/Fnr family transcriptional regulator [Brevundimonas goettingensis]|uniref:Crp/Fnr family transcriptional regulator n=1 Tax=Brevundimonas goettingensis TaxID=2774190 RepID=A0A975GVW8_9CAUL|nr:Crp/Fnr family transcriptional regulator [Brevundimonas goettingensis]QTC91946.1 Crp/Fnr family transcriptional regulator [Brevundimonas goettingensis]
MSLTDEQRAAMATDGWFGALPAPRRALLLDQATPLRLADGARLYGAGDPPNGLWAVVEGQVRLMAYPTSGSEVVIRRLGPGSWCGELSTLDDGPRPQDAIAFGPTLALNIPQSRFVRLAEAEPALWRNLALLGCAHQRESLNFIGQRVVQPPPVRLAKALLNAAANTGSGAPALRQAELAVLVGVSRQTLNRYLKALERDGLVRAEYGRVAILDAERLTLLSRRNEPQALPVGL